MYRTWPRLVQPVSPQLLNSARVPHSCARGNIATNDVAGNFSVTLVDVLDTFIILDDPAGFNNAVRDVIDWVSFDVNTKPQVFETTIRVLGGLLSAHQFAVKPEQPFYLPWYSGELLSLAYDLGKRLLPAFQTPTGLPYARVSTSLGSYYASVVYNNIQINLRHGLRPGESIDTCRYIITLILVNVDGLCRYCWCRFSYPRIRYS